MGAKSVRTHISTTAEAQVDVYIDEFPDETLLYEVNRRGLMASVNSGDSLLDQMKVEIVQNNMHKKSLDEIERFFK